MRSNRFSYQFSEVISPLWGNSRPGSFLSRAVGEKLELPTALRLVQAIGIFEFFRFVRQALPLLNEKSCAG